MIGAGGRRTRPRPVGRPCRLASSEQDQVELNRSRPPAPDRSAMAEVDTGPTPCHCLDRNRRSMADGHPRPGSCSSASAGPSVGPPRNRLLLDDSDGLSTPHSCRLMVWPRNFVSIAWRSAVSTSAPSGHSLGRRPECSRANARVVGSNKGGRGRRCTVTGTARRGIRPEGVPTSQHPGR